MQDGLSRQTSPSSGPRKERALTRKLPLIAALASLVLAIPAKPALAQTPAAYPDKPIKIVMPVPPARRSMS